MKSIVLCLVVVSCVFGCTKQKSGSDVSLDSVGALTLPLILDAINVEAYVDRAFAMSAPATTEADMRFYDANEQLRLCAFGDTLDRMHPTAVSTWKLYHRLASSTFYEAWRAETMEQVRKALQTPEVVMQTYKALKPRVVNRLKTKPNVTPLKQYLMTVVLPYFRHPDDVSQAVKDLMRQDAHEFAACNTGSVDARFDSVACRQWSVTYGKLIALQPHAHVLGWVNRRQAEGGRPLVDAWGDVIADLANSL